MNTATAEQSNKGQIRTPAPLITLVRLNVSAAAKNIAGKKNVPRCDGGAREKFSEIVRHHARPRRLRSRASHPARLSGEVRQLERRRLHRRHSVEQLADGV